MDDLITKSILVWLSNGDREREALFLPNGKRRFHKLAGAYGIEIVKLSKLRERVKVLKRLSEVAKELQTAVFVDPGDAVFSACEMIKAVLFAYHYRLNDEVSWESFDAKATALLADHVVTSDALFKWMVKNVTHPDDLR